jgi:chromosome segregation ATPase
VISLEQVRALEDRVEKAVSYIESLREEGAELRRRLTEAQSFIDEAAGELAEAEQKLQAAEKRAEEAVSLRDADAEKIRGLESRLGDMAERVAAAESRAAELNARAEEYRKDQAKIEEGIVHALEKLDSFEDLVLAQASPATATVKIEEAPAAQPAKASPSAAKPLAPAVAVVEDPAPAVAEPVPADAPEGGSASGPAAERSSEESATLENELDIF